tara:strand:+ start:3663 stop:4730 length:1068 start_codon:yes stop_codon:yes gene_type:complete
MKGTEPHCNLIVHDFLATNGGAEKVTLHLAKILENSEILVSYTEKKIFDYKLKNLNEFYRPIGINFFDFFLIFLKFLSYKTKKNPKNIIFSGIFAPLSQKNFKGKKIYYCHTPPKFLFIKNHWLKKFNWLLWPILNFYKKEYKKSLNQMDIILSNSEYTKNNLHNYFSIKSEVLYPPIEIDEFSYEESSDFYLSTGRLETVKNIKSVIEAFKIMQNKKLVVSSGGTLYEKFKHKYKDCKNIVFTGWLTKDQQKNYLSKCIATIYVPFHEDFGMSSVESLAAGKPVLGINEGGQKEILSHKENSFLCHSSMLVKDIIKGVEFLNKEKCKEMKERCIKTSKKFSSKKFNESLLEIIK